MLISILKWKNNGQEQMSLPELLLELQSVRLLKELVEIVSLYYIGIHT